MTHESVAVGMNYNIGAIQYLVGMLTSVWGVIITYLLANRLIHPLDYIQTVNAILDNLNEPKGIDICLSNIVITGPSEFARLMMIRLSSIIVL